MGLRIEPTRHAVGFRIRKLRTQCAPPSTAVGRDLDGKVMDVFSRAGQGKSARTIESIWLVVKSMVPFWVP